MRSVRMFGIVVVQCDLLIISYKSIKLFCADKYTDISEATDKVGKS